jgi:tetracycline repressor-like protein
MRYCGNKEALFAAASELDLRLPALEEIPQGRLGETLVLHFLNRWADDGAPAAMLRTAPPTRWARSGCGRRSPSKLVPFVTTVCPWPDQAPRRAVLLASQLLGVALCRCVLRMPPAVAMSHAQLAAWIAPTVVRCLTAEEPVSG